MYVFIFISKGPTGFEIFLLAIRGQQMRKAEMIEQNKYVPAIKHKINNLHFHV
jgi:hypothetical protein